MKASMPPGRTCGSDARLMPREPPPAGSSPHQRRATVPSKLAAASLLGRDEGKVPATCALLALICLLVHRLWLLPETHEALTRVDLVALRPAAKLDLALAWQSRGMLAQWAATTLIALAIALRESLALKSLRAVARSVTTRGDADTGG